MKTIRSGLYPSGRLQAGAAILAAAEVADVILVQRRMGVFARAHRAYQQAHETVEAAETELQARQAKVADRDAKQDAALEHLASALAGDRQPRKNPFAAFNIINPNLNISWLSTS